MSPFLWITCASFCAGVGWYLGRMLIEMLEGFLLGDDEDG